MVDTLVSGASASRRVGSTPISGTYYKRLTIWSTSFLLMLQFSVGDIAAQPAGKLLGRVSAQAGPCLKTL